MPTDVGFSFGLRSGYSFPIGLAKSAALSDVVSGVLWAADNGANVILMALSSPTYSAALADAVSYAESKGIVLVAASGNSASTSPTYPAGMPGVIGVAATGPNDNVTASSDHQAMRRRSRYLRMRWSLYISWED